MNRIQQQETAILQAVLKRACQTKHLPCIPCTLHRCIATHPSRAVLFSLCSCIGGGGSAGEAWSGLQWPGPAESLLSSIFWCKTEDRNTLLRSAGLHLPAQPHNLSSFHTHRHSLTHPSFLHTPLDFAFCAPLPAHCRTALALQRRTHCPSSDPLFAHTLL